MAGIDTPLSLLDRLLSHDHGEAWREFSGLYEPLIRRWVGRLVSQTSDIDDIVQEVLKALVEELPGFRHNLRPGAFRTWLRLITIHRIRRQSRGRPPTAGQVSDVRDLEDPRSRLSEIWDREHDAHVIQSLLEKIRPEFDDRTWDIFRRVVFDGCKPREVARDLGCKPNEVYMAKSLVLKRLRLEAAGLIEPND